MPIYKKVGRRYTMQEGILRDRVKHEMRAAYPDPSCYYCERVLRWGVSGDKAGNNNVATLDHIKPYSQGGKFAKENVVVACWSCNQLRGNMPFDRFKNCLTVLEGRCYA